MSNYHIPSGYEIFYDNGKWVSIRKGETRRNIAPHNCRTKIEAIEAAQYDRDDMRVNGLVFVDGNWRRTEQEGQSDE